MEMNIKEINMYIHSQRSRAHLTTESVLEMRMLHCLENSLESITVCTVKCQPISVFWDETIQHTGTLLPSSMCSKSHRLLSTT